VVVQVKEACETSSSSVTKKYLSEAKSNLQLVLVPRNFKFQSPRYFMRIWKLSSFQTLGSGLCEMSQFTCTANTIGYGKER
jgi:hypothetical protein